MKYIHGFDGPHYHSIGSDGIDKDEQKTKQLMRKLKFYEKYYGKEQAIGKV